MKQKWMERNARAGVSRPAGARGLKQNEPGLIVNVGNVAPRRGAWIETKKIQQTVAISGGRAPQGRVD